MGVEAELKKIRSNIIFTPIEKNVINHQQRAATMQALMLLKKNRFGKVKGSI